MVQQKERYSKINQFLDIVYDFANVNKNRGLSIQDLQDDYEICRSTACRIKAAIDRYFCLEETEASKKRQTDEKRWYLDNEGLKLITTINTEDFTQLEVCKKIMDGAGRTAGGKAIERLINKLKVMANKAQKNENDIEILMESQGYAIRQAPKIKIPAENFRQIYDAILSTKCLEYDYKKANGTVKRVCVEPYGIVYGSKTNMVVKDRNDGKLKYHTIYNIKNMKVLDEYYIPDEDFDLSKYVANSFGVYQDDNIMDVKLKFDKSVAESVLDYSFHPSQQMEKLENGDVIVTFRACGDREMCWHFFTWGKNCQVLEPQYLKDKYEELLKDALSTIK